MGGWVCRVGGTAVWRYGYTRCVQKIQYAGFDNAAGCVVCSVQWVRVQYAVRCGAVRGVFVVGAWEGVQNRESGVESRVYRTRSRGVEGVESRF